MKCEHLDGMSHCSECCDEEHTPLYEKLRVIKRQFDLAVGALRKLQGHNGTLIYTFSMEGIVDRALASIERGTKTAEDQSHDRRI